MAWKFTLVCPRCRYLGYGRGEKPCINCIKRSTLASPKKFTKRPREARK